jgi:hypothetical protein
LQETLAACVNVLGIKPENFMNASSLFLIISGLAGLFFGSVQTVGGWWIYQPRVTIFASDPYAAEGARILPVRPPVLRFSEAAAP